MAYELIRPGDTLNYSFTWDDVLGGATISTSTWSISPAGPSLTNSSHTDTETTVFVSYCEFGQVYDLVNQIVTSNNVTEERSMTLRGG